MLQLFMVLMFTKQNETKEGKQNKAKKKHLHTSKNVFLPSEEFPSLAKGPGARFLSGKHFSGNPLSVSASSL